MLFLQCHMLPNLKCLHFKNEFVSSDFIRNCISKEIGTDSFLLYHNGSKLSCEQLIENDGSTIHVVFTLPGGKGGFGSMLRAIGAQIEKTTNREACRDLSGRRLRDINEEQRLKRWISKESERKEEKIRRRQARIERLKAQPKHQFNDFAFEKEISQLPERVDDAVTQGLQKSSTSAQKRGNAGEGPSTSKKSRPWFDVDSTDSDTSETETRVPIEDIPSDSLQDRESSNDTIETSGIDTETSDSITGQREINEDDTSMSKSPIYTQSPEENESSSGNIMEQRETNEDDTSTSKSSIDIQPLEENESKLPESTPEQALPSQARESNAELVNQPINLMEFEESSQLEALGLDKLKSELMDRGLKCGGSIVERAQRLWLIRGLSPSKFPANLKAKGKKK